MIEFREISGIGASKLPFTRIYQNDEYVGVIDGGRLSLGISNFSYEDWQLIGNKMRSLQNASVATELLQGEKV